jgi:hypothetical protein
LEGFLRHVDDVLHPLDDVVGFGRVGLRLLVGAGGGVRGRWAFTEAVGEVAAASAVEVVVKEPKQISMGSARMSAMLAGKMTSDQAAMLHSEFLISPTWRANCQGVRPGQVRKGATQAVVGCLVGGSGPKSVGGSSWMYSELDENGKDTVVLDWFRYPESKTLHPVWWDYAWKEISPRMEL